MGGDTRRAAMDAAVRLLARRNHSAYELSQKLRQRGFGNGEIETVLAECERYHYIDDEETARSFFRELKARGHGFQRIRQEMKKKGLAGDAVDALLGEYAESADEVTNARRAIEKKQARFERETDPRKRREKIYRFLCSRGYSRAVISTLMGEIA
ncbi:recombination regulator RecX [Desulfonema ishimotonii]|uniref:Regulatory protein RecX n=1 Tax=Desulfonema ishimotonii TaxID=45657 RepID=A0A401G3X3_9BACT|nr:regulatory protein RecX [Desulfonema ishimotonii]GBC63942.1 recombination regulator RecX [Desulfonema ishimotonii]